MQQAGLVLCLHAEMNTIPDELAREHAFLKLLAHAELPKRFPKLRMVIEHISTAAGIAYIDLYKNVGGTVTLHHLMLTYEDARSNPHHFCMPIPKTMNDVQTLNRAVLHGKNRRIFFGSDSAPHILSTKVGVPKPKAGVFSSPVLLPKLAEHFADHHRSHQLLDFVATNGAEFYGLDPPQGQVELVHEPYRVPEAEHDPDALVPFLAGRPIRWNVRT
jgi:dihydroorotase